MFEFTCYEDNYAIENYMRGGRFEDRSESTDADQLN